jgi:hypothetical protein
MITQALDKRADTLHRMDGHPFDQGTSRKARTTVRDAAAIQAWWEAERATAAAAQANADLLKAIRVSVIILSGVAAAAIVYRNFTLTVREVDRG